jgi:hypothetical protein
MISGSFIYSSYGEDYNIGHLSHIGPVEYMPRNTNLKAKIKLHSNEWMVPREIYFSCKEDADECYAFLKAMHKYCVKHTTPKPKTSILEKMLGNELAAVYVEQFLIPTPVTNIGDQLP